MRSIVAACAAVVVLTACSGGDSDDDREPRAEPEPVDDVCALLPVEDASRIAGVTYAAAKPLSPGAPIELCSYEQAAIEGPFVLSVSAGAGDLGDAVLGLGMAGEVSEEPIDVPGADAAAVLRTDDGDLAVEQVAAEAGGNVYVVTYGGSTDVAARLLAAALGEDVPARSGDPVPDACGIDPAAAEAALGAPAEPSPLGQEPAWSSCEWDTGAGSSLTLSIARDAGDLKRYVDEHSYVPEGVEPAEITADGADQALLVADPGGSPVSSATALAAVGPVIYEVEVTDAPGNDAATIATDALAVAIGSS